MINEVKKAEGSIQDVDRIPEDLKAIYRTAWEIPMKSLIEMAADRGAFIDQSQSLNLFMESPSIGKLSSMYMYAWKAGLKTTYYLRTMAATHVEKSTVQRGSLNAVSSGADGQSGIDAAASAAPAMPEAEGAVCTMRPGDPGFEECEACQ